MIIAIRSRYMSESPVWAANQGNLREAAAILRKAYNINAHVAQDALSKDARRRYVNVKGGMTAWTASGLPVARR